MAKKTTTFPTGDALHALLVDQKKLAAYTENTITILSRAIAHTGDASKRKEYELERSNVTRSGLQPMRHVTLQGLFAALTAVWAGMDSPVFDVHDRDSFFTALFRETPLNYTQLYSSNARKLADGVWQYYHYYDSFSETTKKANKGFKQSGLQDRGETGLLDIYLNNAMKILKGIRKNLTQLRDERKLHLQEAHLLLIEDIYFQLPGAADAIPEKPVTAEAQRQELALRRLCILAVTALLIEEAFPEKGTPVWCWLQLQSAAAERPTVIHTSIFGSGEVEVQLLPPISVARTAGDRRKTTYETSGGKAPLEQILETDAAAPLLLLHGTGNTCISGAGKTTMLRHLHAALNRKGIGSVMISLCRAYAPDALRCEPPRDGHLYLERALPGGALPEDGVLILDGLDEVCSQGGVQALCHDLDVLTHYNDLQLRIILSSKSAPNTLPGWSMGLSGISRIFDSALKLRVLPLPRKKAQQYLRAHRSDELADHLSPTALLTPFYLRLLTATGALLETPLPIEQHLKARWFLDRAQSVKTPLPSEAEAFYRCLGAHALRLFEADEGSDAGNEQAAFHLFFTLPALAFHAVIHETTDPEFYFRPLPAMDEAFARTIMDAVFSFFAPTLHQFHPYRDGSGLAALATAPPNAENFFHGPASTFFSRRYNFSQGCWQMEFASNALKNNLAALHVANMVVALCHRQKSSPEISEPFDQAAFLYLPRYLIHSAGHYLAMLLDGTAEVQDFLKKLDPRKLEIGGRGRVVLCSLLYHLARFIRPDDSDNSPFFHKWLAATAEAAQAVGDDRLGLEFRLFYLSEESRRTRSSDLPKARAYARQAVTLHRSFPQYIDSDDYNSLGQVYHQQVVALLNSSCDARKPLPEHWLAGPQAKAEADRIEADLAAENQMPQDAVQALKGEQLRRKLQALRQDHAEFSEDLAFAENYCRTLSDLRSRPADEDENAAPDSESLIAAGAEMLCRAQEKVELVRQLPSAPVRLELLVQSSFIAKACTVYAALHATSGAACNNLACLFEENVEAWMLDESLPFWQANPDLRQLFGDAGQYAYTDHCIRAYRFYDKCLHIRRGTQHYAACALLDLLLNDRLHLENSLPVPGGIHPLNDETTEKIEFLFDHISGADSFGRQAGYQLQYWNRLLEEQKGGTGLQADAEALFRQEWQKSMDKVNQRRKVIDNTKGSYSGPPCFDIYDVCLLAQYPGREPLAAETLAADLCRCYLHYCKAAVYRIGHNPQAVLRQEWPRIRQYLPASCTRKFPDWDEVTATLNKPS